MGIIHAANDLLSTFIILLRFEKTFYESPLIFYV